jgi:hypothetical protein
MDFLSTLPPFLFFIYLLQSDKISVNLILSERREGEISRKEEKEAYFILYPIALPILFSLSLHVYLFLVNCFPFVGLVKMMEEEERHLRGLILLDAECLVSDLVVLLSAEW